MRSPAWLVFACLACLAGASPASAMDFVHTIGLPSEQHIDYPSFTSATSMAPLMTSAGVGDVNGDGREDMATAFDSGKPTEPDPVYVTFSTAQASSGNVASFAGFKILVPSFSWGMSSAGDVNGDGLGDIAVTDFRRVFVIFGRTDGATVDAAELGSNGFVIDNVGNTASSTGFAGVFVSHGVAAAGDLNGDGVGDLVVARVFGASIIYPPRNAAGIAIDGATPGPFVSLIVPDPGAEMDVPFVGVLGDIDHDGRNDVMVGGDERVGNGEVAYGVASPPPGSTVAVPSAVGLGRAFAIHTHDGTSGGTYGELDQELTLTDQNHDGIRDIGMVCSSCGTNGPRIRVVYSPSFGASIDAGSLFAADARGWSADSQTAAVDAGDQDGDGDGDIASGTAVMYPDPPHETGNRPWVGNGFWVDGDGGAIVASLADLNGDAAPELLVATVKTTNNNGGFDPTGGQSATYALDIYDSVAAPQIGLPDQPVVDADGRLNVNVSVGSGSGVRGSSTVVLHARAEIATPTGGAQTFADLGETTASGTLHFASNPKWTLSPGETYRVRAAAFNNRAKSTWGPWRTFTAPGTKPVQRTPLLKITASRLKIRKGRLLIAMRCSFADQGCAGTLRVRAGNLWTKKVAFFVPTGKTLGEQVKISRGTRRLLRRHHVRRLTVLADGYDRHSRRVSARATLPLDLG